jgi:hypothetical protein
MNFYSLGQLSNKEKSNILDKHRELYNGYKQVYQPVSNTQDLYVQDFANDKEGFVVTNKGNVKAYTNFGINEGLDDVQNKFTGKFDYTEEIGEEDEYNDEDLALAISAGGNPNFAVAMDTKEEYEVMTSAFNNDIEEEISGPLYSHAEPAYDFVSDGPMQEEDMVEGFYDTNEYIDFTDYGDKFNKLEDYGEKDTAFSRINRNVADVEDIEWEEIVDEDIVESFIEQKNKINEMFDRLNKYN